jgi:hypothetical protein
LNAELAQSPAGTGEASALHASARSLRKLGQRYGAHKDNQTIGVHRGKASVHSGKRIRVLD